MLLFMSSSRGAQEMPGVLGPLFLWQSAVGDKVVVRGGCAGHTLSPGGMVWPGVADRTGGPTRHFPCVPFPDIREVGGATPEGPSHRHTGSSQQ